MFLDYFSYLIYFFVFLLGLFLGSYLNSWMWRVKEGKYQFLGRSICVHCSRALPWYENIPLISFIFLKGKCRTCHGSIPWSYFFVELCTAIIFVIVASVGINGNSSSIEIFRNLFFSALLVVTFFYDLKYQLILPGVMWLGSIVGLFINIKYLSLDPYNLVFGAVIGGGFFWAQYLVSRGRWIGGGDVRLGVMMGLWLGWQNVLLAMFIGYISGAVIGVALLLLKKKEMSSAIPFGTFLSLGTFVALLWGSEIIKWYLGLI
jgi:leader peptidase (prepilin peptidase) / N-methyltransferase